MIFSILTAIMLGFLAIRVGVTLYNFVTWPVLPNLETETILENKIQNSLISILIPARNEEKNIGKLLQNLIDLKDLQVLPFEIIVLNDHSKDATAAIVHQFAIKNTKIKLLEGKDLPIGWLGKNWACCQLAKAAIGSELLFLDADVNLKNGAIINSLQRRKKYDTALLSLFPEQKMETIGEELIVPLMHFLLLNLLPLRLVRTTNIPSLAAANGQFMLFKAEMYHQHQFHEKVKSSILDDVNIMRLIKNLKLKGEVLLGNGQVFCRMYANGNEAFNGFSKNLFLGFDKNIIGFQLYFLLIFWLWVPFFIFLPSTILTLTILLILTERILISRLANQNALLSLILHPLQMILYTFMGLNSMRLHLTGKVIWKGRIVKS